MIKSTQELEILLNQLEFEANNAGIDKRVIREMLTSARKVGINNSPASICVPIVRIGQKNGINIQRMTTIVAGAIKKAEIRIKKLATSPAPEISRDEPVEKVYVQSFEDRQALYGPAPVPETVRIEYPDEPIQALYGPAPVPEVIRFEPEPVKREIDNMFNDEQILYGPPQTPRKPKK